MILSARAVAATTTQTPSILIIALLNPDTTLVSQQKRDHSLPQAATERVIIGPVNLEEMTTTVQEILGATLSGQAEQDLRPFLTLTTAPNSVTTTQVTLMVSGSRALNQWISSAYVEQITLTTGGLRPVQAPRNRTGQNASMQMSSNPEVNNQPCIRP